MLQKTQMNLVLSCVWADRACLGGTEISAVKAKICYFRKWISHVFMGTFKVTEFLFMVFSVRKAEKVFNLYFFPIHIFSIFF